MKIFLRDRNDAMVTAWQKAFEGESEVEISSGDIFGVEADAIVSPANSLGLMVGGIDAAYVRKWPGIDKKIQKELAKNHFGELPVGQAILVETEDASIPYLISAPTMRVSSMIAGTVNAYLAFRAALALVSRHNLKNKKDSSKQIISLLSPGMGTAVGAMPCHIAAFQMAAAYKSIIKGQKTPDHWVLLEGPKVSLPMPPAKESPHRRIDLPDPQVKPSKRPW